MTPEPRKQTAIEFAKARLSLNPEASFAEIKAQANVEGLVVYPVVYGRAKALLGLVPTAPYGSKSKARKARETEPSGPASGGPLAPLEELIAELREAVQERDRYRDTLEKLVARIQAELAR